MSIHLNLKIALGFLLATPLAAAPPIITNSELTGAGSKILLEWTGDNPPYSVQSSSNLSDWGEAASGIESTMIELEISEPSQFFRIIGAEEFELGPQLGSRIVRQGEFDDPLAVHRLKSEWEFFEPVGYTRSTPQDLLENMIVRWKYHLDGEIKTLTTPLASFPGGSTALGADGKSFTATWSSGSGAGRRDYSMRFEFLYTLTSARPSMKVDDAEITLTCDYASPVASWSRSNELGTTRQDMMELVALPAPRTAWEVVRKPDFTVGGLNMSGTFTTGLPLLYGEVPFIYKTNILHNWEPVTIGGFTSQELALDSIFALTYEPEHHNFIEHIWIEPALQPGIDAGQLAELQAADIRMIIVTHAPAFPGQDPYFRAMGFDGVIRDL